MMIKIVTSGLNRQSARMLTGFRSLSRSNFTSKPLNFDQVAPLRGIYCRYPEVSIIASVSKSTRSFSTTAKENGMEKPFTWESFFELRQSMRRWELATGVMTALTSFFGSCVYLFTIASFDPTEQFFGIIDSYTLYIISPAFIALMSYVVGLAGGSSLWRLSCDKKLLYNMDKFNRNFYDRITKYRAPEAAVVSPIPKMSSPDYYGEKIFSPNDYRKWLKKQRMLSRKRLDSEKATKLKTS